MDIRNILVYTLRVIFFKIGETKMPRKEKNQLMVNDWLAALNADEHKAIYNNMTDDQKFLVLLALKYPVKEEFK